MCWGSQRSTPVKSHGVLSLCGQFWDFTASVKHANKALSSWLCDCLSNTTTKESVWAFALHSGIQSLLASRGHLHPLTGQPFWPLLEMTGQSTKRHRPWLCAKKPCVVPQAYISMTVGILVLLRKQHPLPPAQAVPWWKTVAWSARRR